MQNVGNRIGRTVLWSASLITFSLSAPALAKITIKGKPPVNEVALIKKWQLNEEQKKRYFEWRKDDQSRDFKSVAELQKVLLADPGQAGATTRSGSPPPSQSQEAEPKYLPEECRKAVEDAAEPDNGYICVASKANACHQTSTRMAPLFLGTASAMKKDIASFDDLYLDICGHPFNNGSATCHPANSAVYQLLLDDGAAGHSFFVACLGSQGCAVLQGVAGAFMLKDWIKGPQDPDRDMHYQLSSSSFIGTRLPGAPSLYGKMKLLDGTTLHEWLSGVHDITEGEGVVKSVLAFWVCDSQYYNCQTVMKKESSPAAVDFKDALWQTRWQRPDRQTKKYKIVGDKYTWDGHCHGLDAVRQYGANYPSIYCRNKPALKRLCVMGLGMADSYNVPNFSPAKPGYLPLSYPHAYPEYGEDPGPKYECEARTP